MDLPLRNEARRRAVGALLLAKGEVLHALPPTGSFPGIEAGAGAVSLTPERGMLPFGERRTNALRLRTHGPNVRFWQFASQREKNVLPCGLSLSGVTSPAGPPA